MSGAHVVAGANEFKISVDGQEHAATVVLFDPSLDIAVLDVPDLQAPPLEFAHDKVSTAPMRWCWDTRVEANSW
jgi:S1-C subfamily serine protease